jgi:hypothetical protein
VKGVWSNVKNSIISFLNKIINGYLLETFKPLTPLHNEKTNSTPCIRDNDFHFM